MKIDFSRLDALRPTAAVPEGFEPVPEAETPFDSGYEAMYRAAWDFHLETDDRLRAALDYLLAESEKRQILLFSCQKREMDYLQGRENVTVACL